MADDPNVPIQPDDPEPVAPPAEPQVDIEAAYRAIAEAEGWDPRLTRYEMQEFKRRKEDLDRREREFQERIMPPRQESMPDFGGDRYAEMLYKVDQRTAALERTLQEDREEKKREREKENLIQSLGTELDSAFNAAARQAGMTREQISNQANRQEFFALLTEMYPEPEMISRIGSDQAVRNTLRAFKGGNNGAAPTRSPYRDPRATFVIPSGSTSGPMGDDAGPRRANESQEDYVARLKRVLDEAGAKMSTLPERAVINPG